jgi:hypothetical protein
MNKSGRWLVVWLVAWSQALLVNAQKNELAPLALLPAAEAPRHTYVELPGLVIDDTARVFAQLTPRFTQLQEAQAGLALQTDVRSPAGRHLYYRQTWQGMPIYGAGIKLNLDAEGKVLSALSTLVTMPATQAPAKAVGGETLQTQLQSRYAEVAPPQLVWYLQNGRPVACQQTEVLQADGRRYLLLLDAQTSQELLREELTVYYKPRPATADTNGRANIFLPDPLTTAGLTYGCPTPICDNNNADAPILTTQLRRARLRAIQFDGGAGVFRINGPYVTLQDFLAPLIPVATSASGNFLFTRAQSGFDDCMAYFHIDSLQQYVQQLGYNNLFMPGNPLRVDSHGDPSDNSFFSPSQTNPFIAFGIGGIYDAQDADVITHEYSHFLSYMAAPGSNSGTERRGLDEGMADYIAASYSKAISDWQWTKVFNWDGNNPAIGWFGRPSNANFNYRNLPNTSIYTYGSVWCSALMECWDILGRNKVDRAQLQEMYFNAPGMTLRDAALQMIRADSLLFGTANRKVYARAFCRRGVLPNGRCTLADTLILAPGAALPGIQAFPNPTGGQLTLNLGFDQPADVATVRLLDLGGRVQWQQDFTQGLYNLSLPPLANGVYILLVETRGGQRYRQKLVLAR